MLISLFLNIETKAQWLPTGTSTTADIYRSGKVNIGGSTALTTTSPLLSLTSATTSTVPSLSVLNGNVVFSGTGTTAVPITGYGSRMMWVPAKRAFRAGYAAGTEWDYTKIGYYSMALGYNVKASGSQSIAIGSALNSTGANSYTFGHNISATNTGTISLGVNNYVVDPLCYSCEPPSCVNNIANSLMVFYNKPIPSLFVNFQGVGVNTTTLNPNVSLQVNGITHIQDKLIIGNSISTSTYTTTGTPGTYKLFVQGGILTEKLKVAILGSINWADYVFTNDYKLMPLNKVETYIKANKHLPNIPSAQEMEANGLDVVEIAAKQMEKIEELTLYIIQMNKEINALKQDIKTLQSNKK